MKKLFNASLTLAITPLVFVLALLLIAGCERENYTGVEKKPAVTAPAKFINARCPIMGSPIDSNSIPENLTRTFKGQKVAFCCGGCPSQWDKLSDNEKEAKVREAALKK